MRFSFLAVCAALLLAGCDVTGTGADSSPPPRGESALAPVAGDAGGVSESDARSLYRISANSLGVVTISRVAANKATDPAVKAFAKRVQTSHADLNIRIERLAGEKGVKLPRGLSDGDQRELNRLKKLTGKDFDKAYVEAMIHNFSTIANTMHEQTKDGSDREIRRFCGSNEAAVRERNQGAKALKAQLAK